MKLVIKFSFLIVTLICFVLGFRFFLSSSKTDTSSVIEKAVENETVRKETVEEEIPEEEEIPGSSVNYHSNDLIPVIRVGIRQDLGYWNLRQYPCLDNRCMYPSRPVVSASNTLYLLDPSLLVDTQYQAWYHVRAIWNDGSYTDGYIHSNSIIQFYTDNGQ